MTISPERVNRENSNIRKYSDSMWRELRKLRFKPAKPNPYTNEMAAEQMRLKEAADPDFDHDVNQFINLHLSPREGEIFRMYLYGGRVTQSEIAEALGICQGTVHNHLEVIFNLFKEFYYA